MNNSNLSEENKKKIEEAVKEAINKSEVKFDDKLIVYASDLGFNTKDKLIEFAKDAYLLLIESSFVKSDNQNSDFHLHAYESAMIAKESNVNRLYLTHFWPSHNKYEYLKEAKKIFKNTYLSNANKKIKL